MLQDNRSLNATTPSPSQADVEETLSFNSATGKFTFGSSTQPITGAFRIPLTATQTITINAGQGIEFIPLTSTSEPFGPLPFNNSGAIGVASLSSTQIEIDVTTLPSRNGVLGFLLFVQLTSGSPSVQGIETPPFFITLDQSFTEPEFHLSFDPATSDFQIRESGGSMIRPIIPIERGVVLLRLGEGGSNDSEVQDIHVALHEDTVSAGIIFAQTAAIFTQTSGSVVPTATRNSNTELTITRAFTSGTGFGVSFGVDVPIGGGQTCTVYSPDPIIFDKQIGGSG